MTNIMFSITDSVEFSGASILIDGESYTVNRDHPAWDTIFESLRDGTADEDSILELIKPADAIGNAMVKLSERVTYRDGVLLFDNDVIDSALSNIIVSILKSSTAEDREQAYTPFVLFLEKLATNPSTVSQEHLYHFISTHGLTLAADGDFIAYKGVDFDGLSVHGGYGIVDGVEYGKVVNNEVVEHKRLPNNIGSVIEIPRSMVNDDRNIGCSTGLHAGTYDYARSFAKVLRTVKINPRDVVSVPSDYENAKLRVARYFVLEDAPSEQYTAPVIAAEAPVKSVAEAEAEKPAKSKKSKKKSKKAKDKTVSTVTVTTKVTSSGALTHDQRVNKMADVIQNLPKNTPLRRYRNKNITPANRAAFDQAMGQLGLSY